jgi:hypothetical protein
MSHPFIRHLYVCAYAALAAIGLALVARPAILWVRSQGLHRAGWEVLFGPLFVAAAATVTVLTAWLAFAIALRRKRRTAVHLALLLAVALCFALRQIAGS